MNSSKFNSSKEYSNDVNRDKSIDSSGSEDVSSDEEFDRSDRNDSQRSQSSQNSSTTRRTRPLNKTYTFQENSSSTFHEQIRERKQSPNVSRKSLNRSKQSLNTSKKPKEAGRSHFGSFVGITVIVVAVVCFFLYHEQVQKFTLKFHHKDSGDILVDVKNKLTDMKSRFKNQDSSLWGDIFGGIARVVKEPKKPSIVVLLGNGEATLNCLAVMLGNISRVALQSAEALELTPKKLGKNMGDVIETFRDDIKEKKAVVSFKLHKCRINFN